MPAFKVPAFRRSARLVLILAVALASWSSHAAARTAAPAAETVLQKGAVPPPLLLTLPTSGTANPVTLTGTAPANAEVRIFVNGDLLEVTTADTNGSFTKSVPLYDGANTVTATAVVSQIESAASNALSSTYTNTLPRNQAGNIAADTVWTVGSGPYTVTGNLTVLANVELTLMAGVEIRFASSTKLDVRGNLIVNGKSAAGTAVTMRGASQSTNRGQWQGVRILGAGYVEMNHALMENATCAIYFTGGDGSIRNSTFQYNNCGTSIGAGTDPEFGPGFVFRNNGQHVQITGNDTALGDPNPRFNGGLFDLYNTSRHFVCVDGGFDHGSTRVIDARGNRWGSSSATGPFVEHTNPSQIAERIDDSSELASRPTIDFGGYLGADGNPVFSGGFIAGGPVTANRTIAAGDYQLLGTLRVASGVTVTIEPGATIRAPKTAPATTMEVAGTLVAHGAPGAEIVFRSAQTSGLVASLWGGINVTTTGVVDFDYVRVEHAATGLNFSGGEGLVRHTTMTTNGFATKVNANSSPIFEDGFLITQNGNGVTIAGNGNAASNPLPVFRNGAIHGNSFTNFTTTSFGNAATVVLDASGNCWMQDDPQLIRNLISDRYDQPTGNRPLVDFIEFQEVVRPENGSPSCVGPKLTSFDFTFPRRNADVLGALAAQVDFVLNTAAGVAHEIIDEENGSVVRHVESAPLPRGKHRFEWDGRNDGGDAVREGLYRVVQRLTHATVPPVTIDPDIPFGEPTGHGLIPPRFNGYRNEFMKILYTNTYPNGDSSRLHLRVTQVGGPYGTQEFYPSGIQVVDSGETWLYWDGRDPLGRVLEGEIEIYSPTEERARPHFLRVARAQPKITGVLGEPDIEVKSDPNLVYLSYEQPSSLAFQIDTDAYVTVKLLPPGISDPASAQAIVLLPEQMLLAEESLGVPRVHTVPWLGHENNDVNRMRVSEEGAYTFTIEARSPLTQRSAFYRGVLQVRW